MKNKILLFLCLIFMIMLLLLNSYFCGDNINENIYQKYEKSMLSMMLEQNSGAGDYLQVVQSNWPTEGYIFNKERSGCENGGELSWDDTRKTVVMMGNTSDKCYVYFDIWFPSIADYCNNKDYLASCVKAFGNAGSDISNIYIHNSSLANGAGDNSYRYAGASDKVYNFVCFGSTETPCPNDNLYRIIGVIDDKVKLIKYDYANSNLLGTDGDFSGGLYIHKNYYRGKQTNINSYSWNYKADTTINDSTGSNTWSTSLLNKTNLNTNFLNNLGTFWTNKIATTTWKVGGNTFANMVNVVPSVAYQNEIINPDTANSTDNATTYNAKVGLMYISEYGFAASPSAWTTNLYNYNNSTSIINSSWIHMGLIEWTNTRDTSSKYETYCIDYTGNLPSGKASYGMGIRPSFNLEPFVTYKSGKGTESDPIIIN